MNLSIAQESVSIASSIVALICLLVPFLFKKELEGHEEKYYLVAFYIGSVIHFSTVVNPQTELSTFVHFFKSVSIINGALLPFLLAAFVCKRERERGLFYALVVTVFINISIHLMYPKEVYLSVLFAFMCNGIGLVAIVRNIKNKADIGLAVCFAVLISALLFVLIKASFHVTPIEFYGEFYFWLLVIIPGFISGATVFIFLRHVIELNTELAKQAHNDPLTGLYNRRFAADLINKQIQYLKRQQKTASVVMADIDHFKKVNDTYGHLVGDDVIKCFAEIISNEVREYDVACRYGGEEFVLFLPDTQLKDATVIADRIRQKLEDTVIKSQGVEVSVSASFGISSGIPELMIEQAINDADVALYQAKRDGRNRVIAYEALA